jgi:hypothetical protein
MIITGLSCTKKLTRKKAAKMIIEKYRYPQDVYTEVGSLETLKELKDRGLIDIKWKSSGDWWWESTDSVWLTKNGELIGLFVKPDYVNVDVKGKLVTLIRPSLGSSKFKVVGKCYKEVFTEVTGMKIIANGTEAEVEYTYRYDSITPFGVILGYKSDEIYNSNCQFTLYDEGWRIK